MERIELKSVELHIGDSAPLACSLPFSLVAARTAKEQAVHPFVGRQLIRTNEYAAAGCTLYATFSVQKAWQSARLALELRDVQGICRVTVNDTPLGTVGGLYDAPELDVGGAVHSGENTLCLTFEAPGVYKIGNTEVKDIAVRQISLCVYAIPSIIWVETHSRKTDIGFAQHVKAHVHGADKGTKVVATLTSDSGKMYYAGLTQGEGDVVVSDPIPWHVGTSRAPLYRLSVTLYHDDSVVDEYTQTIGLCDIRIEGESSHGRRDFRLMVNGERVFMKGCTVRRPSLFLTGGEPSAEERIARQLSELGFNTAIVPEDEPFPSEHLLSLFDGYGILVWKKLPSLPTEDDARGRFFESLRRLLLGCASHPSFAMVTAAGDASDGTLRELVREVSPSLFFMNCTETERANHTAVLWDTTEFCEGVQMEGLPVCIPPPAFMPTSSLYRFAEEDARLYGRTVEQHALGVHVPTMLLAAEEYPFPHGTEAAVYVTQRHSADVAARAAEAARRNAPNGDGILLGTLNELYPSVTSALTDAFGERRLSYYGVRHALTPTLLSAVRSGYRVSFHVHNDRPTPYVGRLVYRLCDRYNACISEGTYDVTVSAREACEVASTELSTLVFGHEADYYLYAYLYDGRTVASSVTCLFTEPRYFRYAPQAISTEVRGEGQRFEVILRAAAFMHGVFVSFGTLAVTAKDNLLDITSDMPVRIEVETEEPCTVEQLSAALTVMSVNAIDGTKYV